MKRLSFYAACLLLACHGASANETILEFDKANAGTRNLCGAPVKFVVITGMAQSARSCDFGQLKERIANL